MGAWTSLVNTLEAASTKNVADLIAALRQLLSTSQGTDATLDDYSLNASIESKSTTTVNFVHAPSTRRRIKFNKDGRRASASALPTALTISGSAGTKYVYADLGTEDANGISTITLVQSITAPASETTLYRFPLGEVEWDGVAITAVRSYGPAMASTSSSTGRLYVQSSAPSSAVEGDLWYDTVTDILRAYDGSTWRRPAGSGRNLLLNSSAEQWGNGTSVAPDGWSLNGAGSSVARNTTEVAHALASMALTRSGTDCTLKQDVLARAGGATYAGARTYTLRAMVRTTTASRARIGINDGVSTTFSGYHPGTSVFAELVVTKTLVSSPTVLEAVCQVDSGNTTAQFDAIVLAEGDAAPPYAAHPDDSLLEARTTGEATTSSTSPVDLVSVPVNIAQDQGFMVRITYRKTSGAPATGALGLKLNSTQIMNNATVTSGTNQAESGYLEFRIAPRSTNYGISSGGINLNSQITNDGAFLPCDNTMPTGTITAVVVTGQVANASITLAVRDIAVWLTR
jgi:hypothetical protein